MRGNNVSHANNKTKRTQSLNLHRKRFFVSELSQWIRIRVSSAGVKTLTKYGGLAPYLLKTPLEKLDPDLRRWKRAITSRLKINCA